MTGPLRRGQAPWLRPTRAQVQRAGQWVDSPRALAALDKRILYPPVGWPEELDDGRSASGLLRLTFTDTFPIPLAPAVLQGVLHLRVRVSGGRVPACAIHGPVILLGHNTTEPLPRGWHPAALLTGALSDGPTTLDLHLDVPCSRALLGRA